MKFLAENGPHNESAPWTQVPDVTVFPALSAILQRDWFHRMWVVQEACVSRKAVMICGNDSFGWDNDPVKILKFIRRIKYAAISPQWEQAGLSQVNMDIFLQLLYLQIQHLELQTGDIFLQTRDILDVAYSLRHRECADRRDKLFAIMGLVAQDRSTFHQPDYTANVDDVYKMLLDNIEI